jgi:hypothetical protein
MHLFAYYTEDNSDIGQSLTRPLRRQGEYDTTI